MLMDGAAVREHSALWVDKGAFDDGVVEATGLRSCMDAVEAVGDLVPAEFLIDQGLDVAAAPVVACRVVRRPVGI